MKLTLRFTLTAILLALTLFTVASLGYISYRNARFTAADLSAQKSSTRTPSARRFPAQ